MLIENDNYKLYLGDCLEVMDELIEKGVKVDMVLCDPPYGTTHCKWDCIIPFEPMWDKINKLSNGDTPILLFGRQPFTSQLINSNLKMFRYELIWEKERATNFMFLKKQFGQCTENISVFYKHQPTYNPQMRPSDKPVKTHQAGNKSKTYNNQFFKESTETRDGYYPLNILKFNREIFNRYHPTQKPVALLEYLIKTYTNENEIVLDFTMGSGSTGVACMNTNRHFIGIELDKEYFDTAVSRIENKE